MFEEKLENTKKAVENEIINILNINNGPSEIKEPMIYSLTAGGKKIRPVLFIKAFECFNKRIDKDIIRFASALEMIHTYSLIHDDLPSIDNDDYRRGKLTNHKVFGEALAILSGDGLLNLAYETMIEITLRNIDNCKVYLEAMNIIGKNIGIEGMIGGQVKDILSDSLKRDIEELQYIQKNKTSKLIEASIVSGAKIGGADYKQLAMIEEYATNIGIMFQIKDDLLDVIGNREATGKSTGIDEKNNRMTYVTVYGVNGSIEKIDRLKENAINALNKIENADIDNLKDLVEFLAKREN